MNSHAIVGDMTSELITLPDGSQALFVRSMDYGQAVIILLLVGILFLLVIRTWRER